MLGFFAVYYTLFVKHHDYDRKVEALRSDVEALMKHARESGFMNQDFKKAEVPEIFREVDLEVENPQNASSDVVEGKYSKPKETKKGVKKPSSKEKKAAVHSDKSTALSTERNEQSEEDNNSATGDAASIESQNTNSAKKHGNQTSPQNGHNGSKETRQTGGSSLAKQLADSQVSSEETAAGSTVTSSVFPGSKPQPVAATAGTEQPQDAGQYKDFLDLKMTDVPKGKIPLLNWNYGAVLRPETKEQVFGLGNKLDHIGSFKPFCVDTRTGNAITFGNKTICGGFNRTEMWMHQYCPVMKECFVKESLLKFHAIPKPITWLTEEANEIEWVEGLTIFQVYEKNCGNIAHFAGRALLLQHLIENMAAYAAPPNEVKNIVILPTFHIMKRFLYPQNYEFWHKSMLDALVAPAKVKIGTLGNFLYRSSKPHPKNIPLVQLLHNYSLEGSPAGNKKYVCFKRAIVPGYLKARFFVNDVEYPSKKKSLQSKAADGPSVPRDSLRMREKVHALFHQTPKIEPMHKDILLLDRGGSRRVFANEARSKILKHLKAVAGEKGYTFKVVSFDKMPFGEQYNVMKDAAIAIGIHGANLVNTIFMPPLSALIELFPYGFVHQMYLNGGNAGLKYFSYQMSTGQSFQGPGLYRSVEQCVRLSPECKVFYRDAMLQMTDEDVGKVENILREAIEWCDKVPKATSRRRRRRLFNYVRREI